MLGSNDDEIERSGGGLKLSCDQVSEAGVLALNPKASTTRFESEFSASDFHLEPTMGLLEGLCR